MTDVALREYLERLIHEADRRYDERFRASEQAVLKAERAMGERLNSMNEFRDALRDQAGRMATREELTRVDKAVQELQRARANLDGKIVVLASIPGVLVAVALWALTMFVK